MRIVLTGGGTGGHIMPFEPIIEALRSRFIDEKQTLPLFVDPQELSLYYMGVSDKSTRDFFSAYDVPAIHVPSGKLRRYFSLKTISDLCVKFPFGFLLALFHLWKIMPDVVISKGGYGSLPVALAATWYRIPILLHESDVVPGLANSFLMRYAKIIALGFPDAKNHLPNSKWLYKTSVTGTPIRAELDRVSIPEAKSFFALDSSLPTLLVVGGSQGARQLNELILGVLSRIILDMNVIHVTGEANFTPVTTVAEEILAQSSRKEHYKAYPYLTDKMSTAIRASDGVLTRAGASMLAELVHARIPMLIIPLDSAAGDHQRYNARAVESAGAGLVLDPKNTGVHLVEQNIRSIMLDEKVRESIKTHMNIIDFPNAGRDIASLALKLAKGLAPSK